jgi:2-polyprenyl-3-methyl-5-hydroxy-6-metoxy-1,4-benzoquinol methylase
MDIKELETVNPHTHWYYQSKIIPFIRATEKYSARRKTLIEVGAGSGFFSESMCQKFLGLTAICVDTSYETEWRSRDRRISFVKRASINNADVFIFADVLEHVSNDVLLIQEYVGKAETGSLVLISVPAFMFLWSNHDVYLEHYRRYTRAQLEEIVKLAGLEILESRYLFAGVFPLVYLKRLFRQSNSEKSDMKEIFGPMNALLRAISKFEHKWVRSKYFGTSVFIAARVR